MIWLNIGLPWKLSKIRSSPILVLHPKQVLPRTDVLFLWKTLQVTSPAADEYLATLQSGESSPIRFSRRSLCRINKSKSRRSGTDLEWRQRRGGRGGVASNSANEQRSLAYWCHCQVGPPLLYGQWRKAYVPCLRDNEKESCLRLQSSRE